MHPPIAALARSTILDVAPLFRALIVRPPTVGLPISALIAVAVIVIVSPIVAIALRTTRMLPSLITTVAPLVTVSPFVAVLPRVVVAPLVVGSVSRLFGRNKGAAEEEEEEEEVIFSLRGGMLWLGLATVAIAFLAP